jgi:hypothetical protein
MPCSEFSFVRGTGVVNGEDTVMHQPQMPYRGPDHGG